MRCGSGFNKPIFSGVLYSILGLLLLGMFLPTIADATAPTLSGSYTAESCVKGCVTGSDSWNTNCSGTYAAMAHGGTATVTNTASGYTGSETATCNNSGTGAVTFSSNTCTAAACAVPSAWQSACGSTTISSGHSCSGYSRSGCNNYNGIYCSSYTLSISCSGSTLSGDTTATTIYVTCTDTNIGCFLPETEVTMADGTTKRIDELKVGDAVKGHSRINHVVRPTVHRVSGAIYSFNGGDAFVTGGHPFWTKDGWKAVDPSLTPKEHHNVKTTKLEIGDALFLDDGSTLTLRSIEAHDMGERDVYSPIMDGDHTYYARHLLVHNKCNTC